MNVIVKKLSNFSAILPAALSYFFNVIVASSVDVSDYTRYITFISWATFIAAVVPMSFVDLSISRQFGDSNHKDNLTLSLFLTVALTWSLFGLVHGASGLPDYVSDNLFLFALMSHFLAWTRVIHLYLANTRNIQLLVISRVSRAVCLLLLSIFYFLLDQRDYAILMVFKLLLWLLDSVLWHLYCARLIFMRCSALQ